MCGICGVVDFSGNLELRDSVQKMSDMLVHRGPDDSDLRLYGEFSSGGPRVALAHRRLSVIDLSAAGRQPMVGRSEETAIVFNGEIYNFLEIKSEISEYPFRSQTDTEVILALYEKYDLDVVRHLDGMFSFAIWDAKKKRLLLARDRAGKKPLYYCRGDGFFAFASEIKGILALKEVRPSIRPDALPLYLTFGYVPSPSTFYTEIWKLPPGESMTVEADASVNSRRYWSYPLHQEDRSLPEQPLDLASHESSLRKHLHRAVAARMIADVPLGAFLSGGIDSSIIVGIMSDISPRPINTFSIGFEDDLAYDETAHARLVATRFRTHHTEFRVRSNAIELLEKLIWHYDEPFGDSSAIPTYIVSELARKHVTVVLSGDGGDELFAGYERFAATLWTEKLPKEIFAAGRFLSRFMPAPAHAKSRRRRIKRFFEKAALPLLDRYLEWNSFFMRNELDSLLLAKPEADLSRSFADCFSESARCTLLNQILFLNFSTYLLDDLLVKTDRMSMAHGLEVRCPFLDTGLVEWAAGMPDSFKIRGTRLKWILKHAFRDLLPPEILARGKMGFGVPLGQWMRQELNEFSWDMLLGPSARILEAVDRKAMQHILVEHRTKRQDYGAKIWALLCLELWLRNLKGGISTAPGSPGFEPITAR